MHNNAELNQLYKRLNDNLRLKLTTLDCPAPRLQQAMNYSIEQIGKRIRPLLVYLTGLSLDCPLSKLDAPSMAIEIMHTYSLIHDDLPAMDDDDLRRGQPTNHIAFDEATAILAGDGLHSLALSCLIDDNENTNEQQIEMMRSLLLSSGPCGMIAGQQLDLCELTQSSPSEETLKKVHGLKTGKLIECSVEMGLIAAKASSEQRNALLAYAKHLGLAFQIQDDYLDRYGDTKTLGKQQGADLAQDKFTFATLYDQAGLKQRLAQEYDLALSALAQSNAKTGPLVELCTQLLSRCS